MSTNTLSMTISQARAILAGAFEKSAAEGFNPLGIVVLDAGGRVVAFEREDGASYGRFEVAHGKAAGAMAMGVNGRNLEKLAETRPHFMIGVNGALGGAVVPVAGGVVVVNADGAQIGAVGASGDNSDNDEIAILAGIEAAGLSPL